MICHLSNPRFRVGRVILWREMCRFCKYFKIPRIRVFGGIRRFQRFRQIPIITLFLAITSGNLGAYNFSKCQEFYRNNSQEFAGVRAIHIGNGEYLAHSKTPLDSSAIIKKDELLGLYLFKGEAKKSHFHLVSINPQAATIAINAENLTQGKILQAQKSYIDYALFSHKIPPNSAIIDICYQFYGISVGDEKFVDKTYLTKFLRHKEREIVHGYISVGISESKNGVVITNLNPFFAKSYPNIAQGDIIESINGKKVRTKRDFIDAMFEIAPNSEIDIVVKRGNKSIKERVKSVENDDFGGNDTALSFLQIIVDNNLIVRKNLSAFDLRLGDRILRVNQIPVASPSDLNAAIMRALEEFQYLSLLLSRDDFEFFLTIKDGLL